jgi:hypothetical protein
VTHRGPLVQGCGLASLPSNELTGDFGNATDAISISGLELSRFLAEKSLPGNYSVGGGRLNPRIFF